MNESGAWIDELYDRINEMMLHGEWKAIDSEIYRIDTETLGTVGLLAWLTITASGKSHLSERASFFERAHGTIERRGENATALLEGLE
jgi:hypothetical protein